MLQRTDENQRVSGEGYCWRTWRCFALKRVPWSPLGSG
jgi:hypothetical protein